MKGHPENEELPPDRQGAISDEETEIGCAGMLIESIRFARCVLSHEEFHEWMESLRFHVAFEQVGSDSTKLLDRYHVAREVFR